jgi:ATPase subunit of ABC transporter with duplicated ATPase domains
VKWIYQMNRAGVRRGGKTILAEATLSFLPGAKVGVVGPNGSGKSTMLKLMAGLVQPSSGAAMLATETSVGILLQEPSLDEHTTVLGNVQASVAQTRAMLERFTELTQQLAREYSDELMAEMGKLQERLDHLGAWDLDSQLEQAMEALRCPPPEAEIATLSGGQRRRVALCALLLRRPDLLLLDEPTNHLDAESVQWLEQHLESYPGTVVAVTHDRYFLANVAQWILELDHGRAYPYEGNYTTYLQAKRERLKVEGRKDAKRRLRLEQELDWVRSGGNARQAKSRARLQRYEEMAAQAGRTGKTDFSEIQIPPGPRLGNLVIEVEALRKSYGDRLLIDGMSFSLPRNGIVGVLGPNGVGETTLFRMLIGAEQPDAGSIRIGDTVKMSYVDQNRIGMDSERTAWELVSGGDAFLTAGHVEIPRLMRKSPEEV